MCARLVHWVYSLLRYSPGDRLTRLFRIKASCLDTNLYRLLYELQGSLIPLAPHTFVSQCQQVLESHLHLKCSFWSLPISLVLQHFHTPLPHSSKLVILYFSSIKKAFSQSSAYNLHTLYTKSAWTTLAIVVWPLLLAQSLDITTLLEIHLSSLLVLMFTASPLFHVRDHVFELSLIDHYSRLQLPYEI